MDRWIRLGDALQLNGVVWISSLREEESGPTRRMVEDLEPLVDASGRYRFTEVTVPDKATMLQLLREIADQARGRARPILHFDCHGSAQDGLRIEPSGEWLSWKELIQALRGINIATQNSLVCVFAACFGLHVFLEMELAEPTPFYLAIGPEREVEVGVLLESVVAFYRDVLEGRNIGEAHERILSRHFQLLHCKGILMQGLARYISTNCIGKPARRRQERMVTALLARDGVDAPTPEILRKARDKVKAAFAPSQKLIDDYGAKFLIGREPGFDISQLNRLARSDFDHANRRKR